KDCRDGHELRARGWQWTALRPLGTPRTGYVHQRSLGVSESDEVSTSRWQPNHRSTDKRRGGRRYSNRVVLDEPLKSPRMQGVRRERPKDDVAHLPDAQRTAGRFGGLLQQGEDGLLVPVLCLEQRAKWQLVERAVGHNDQIAASDQWRAGGEQLLVEGVSPKGVSGCAQCRSEGSNLVGEVG